jgi:hypothetical protein
VQVADGKEHGPTARLPIQVYDAAGTLIHQGGGPLTKGEGVSTTSRS